MSPKIHSSFWSDPDIENQSADVKLALLWIMTNAQTTIIGTCLVSRKRFKFETGLKETVLADAIQAMPHSLFQSGDLIFVRGYIRQQFGVGQQLMANNCFKAMCAAVVKIRDEALLKTIQEEYPELNQAVEQALTKPLVSPSKPLPTPSQGVIVGEGERETAGEASGESAERGTPPPPETPPKESEFTLPEWSTPAFAQKFEKWIEVRKAQGKKPKDWRTMFQEQLDWLRDFGEGVAIEILGSSIRNNYQGLFEPKTAKTNGNTTHRTEADRDRANTGIVSTAGTHLKRLNRASLRAFTGLHFGQARRTRLSETPPFTTC